MQQRNHIFDALKAFGIFCIILGHNNYGELGKYVYSFHIPLFFMVSGYFFDSKKHYQFLNFAKRKAQLLLQPYFLISVLLFLFWYFVGRKFGVSAEKELSPLKNFIGIFYAQGGQEYMDWGIPMWFLPALFLTSIAFFPIAKLKSKNTVLLIPLLAALA